MPRTNSTHYAAVLFLLVSSSLCSFSVNASQTFRVKNGDTVSVKISSRELTRIAVSRDGRLDKVYGASGLIDVQPDMDLGEVYIRVLPGAPQTMSFFVRDVSGGVYTIVATQSDIPSETIILEPADLRNQMLARDADLSIPYVERIKALMKAMANDEEVEGYYRENSDQIVPLWHETNIRLLQIYETVDLFGEVYRVENVSSNVMSFHESEFTEFGSDVKAVALDRLALDPGQSTQLYVVRGSKELEN